MIIKREDDNDEVDFTFRILNISQNEFNVIQQKLENNFKYSTNKKGDNINVLIEIENIEESANIIELTKDHLLSKIDIYISIMSSYDHGGITVPDYILLILHTLKCKLNFSYVLY